MTNKLFLSLVTATVAGTTLLSVQSSYAVDVVSTTGFASTTVTPTSSVSTSAAVSVGYGRNATSGSGTLSTAGKGTGSATAVGAAGAGDAVIVGRATADVTTAKKATIAGASALVGAAGNGTTTAGTTTFATNNYGGATGAFGGTVVSPINVKGFMSKEKPNLAGSSAVNGAVVTP